MREKNNKKTPDDDHDDDGDDEDDDVSHYTKLFEALEPEISLQIVSSSWYIPIWV